MHKLKNKLVVVLLLIFSIGALAGDIKGNIGINYTKPKRVQPEFTLEANFDRSILSGINFRLKNGYTDWNDSLLFPSQAVSAYLLSGSYDFSFSLFSFDWRYERLLSPLWDRRYFIAHRIRIDKEDFPFYLDFYETSVVVGDGNDVWVMFNPVPFLPVYLVQHIGLKKEELKNRDINVCMGFNLGYRLADGGVLFTDIIVDDFPQNPLKDVQLPVMGITVAYNSQEIKIKEKDLQYSLGYTANTRFLHAHYGGEARYTNRYEFLGDDLGPDADRILLMLGQKKPDYSSVLCLSYERHGPGDLTEHWLDMGREKAWSEFFLSDILERKLGVEASFKKEFASSLTLKTDAKIQRIYPKEGNKVNRLQGALSMIYSF